MNGNVIKIKCSHCGAILAVRNQAGLASKRVTCPVCKSQELFSSYRVVDDVMRNAGGGQAGLDDYEPTEYPGGRGGNYAADGPTRYAGSRDDTVTDETLGPAGADPKTRTAACNINFTLGKLLVPSTGQSYRLKPGRNVIGRKAQSSSADFQIAGDDKRMSREHLVIEVKKERGKGFVHYISLFKERCNRTEVGRTMLEYGDCIILHHGDKVRLPGAEVKFEIPDGDGTEY